MRDRRLRIWIDLANSPHVLFFEPVIRELERRGHSITVTARRFANTLALAGARRMRVRRIGSGHDTNRSELFKQAHYFSRTLRLMAFARQRFDVAASHLSYTQATAARRLGIPAFAAADYEHARFDAFRSSRCMMVPSVVPLASFEKWGFPAGVVRAYEGLKEHVYLSGFKPAPDVRQRLGVAADEILVSFRPIAEHAHYGNGHGDEVQRRILDDLTAERGVRVVVLPRTERQRRAYGALAAERAAVRLSEDGIDGPSLISASDLVVTGGGTMLREAAVLGVPAVSCFTGPVGAVDRWLASEGKVILVRGTDDLRRIPLRRRASCGPPLGNGVALGQIVQAICETADPS